MNSQPKAMTWAGWILTIVVGGGLIFSGVMKLVNPPDLVKEVQKFGYPDGVMFYIGIVEIICAVLYLVPQTAVLGAVLLTGYMGGAIATHVRISDAFVGPAIGGVLVWLAIFLRDPRVRALLPIRCLKS